VASQIEILGFVLCFFFLLGYMLSDDVINEENSIFTINQSINQIYETKQNKRKKSKTTKRLKRLTF